MNRKFGLGVVAAVCCLSLASMASASDQILGTWLTEDRDSRIEFAACGDVLCGSVVWLQQETDEQGNPYRDIRNPDAALRDRTILGLTIFQNLRPHDDGHAVKGTVYNPDDGDTYETFVSVLDDGQLEVKGCVLGGFICSSEYWTRWDQPDADGTSN